MVALKKVNCPCPCNECIQGKRRYISNILNLGSRAAARIQTPNHPARSLITVPTAVLAPDGCAIQVQSHFISQVTYINTPVFINTFIWFPWAHMFLALSFVN
jgi:hypothetical protein